MNEDNENQKNFDFLNENQEKDDTDTAKVKVNKLTIIDSNKVYLPVSSENLADYIANGFVGLLTKKDKTEDFQSKVWPKYISFLKVKLVKIIKKKIQALMK